MELEKSQSSQNPSDSLANDQLNHGNAEEIHINRDEEALKLAKKLYREKLYGKNKQATTSATSTTASSSSTTNSSSEEVQSIAKQKELEDYILLVKRAIEDGLESIRDLTGDDEDNSLLRYEAEHGEIDEYDPLTGPSIQAVTEETKITPSLHEDKATTTVNAKSGASHVVYYCSCCGTLSLVANKPILTSSDGIPPTQQFHIRPEDESTIIPEEYAGLKRFTKSERVKYITRNSNIDGVVSQTPVGVEKQYRYHCKSCDLPLFYRFLPQSYQQNTSAPQAKLSYTYIIKDALTDNQNQAKVMIESAKEVYLQQKS